MIPKNVNGRLRNAQGLSSQRFGTIMQRAGAERLTWIRILRIEQGLLPPTKAEARLWCKLIPGVAFSRVRPDFKRRKNI